MKVLVLNASALHLGFLGCYGNAWVATPNLDRLAAGSVVFDQHFANDLNQQSGASIGTLLKQALKPGNFAITHIPADAGLTLEQIAQRTVADLTNLEGAACGLCWVDLPSLHPPWRVTEEFTAPYLKQESPDESDAGQPLEALSHPSIGPLDPKDLLLWDRLRSTYAGAVTSLDAGLGLLFETMQQRGIFEDLLIVFTADRGLALGEHGIIGACRPWVHDEVVHLPLIVRQPGGADAGRRVFALTQPMDIAATLLDLFGGPVPQSDGHSFVPLLRNEAEAVRVRCFSRWQLGSEEEWAVRTRLRALLLPVKQTAEPQPRPAQLYMKPEDRWEVNNVIQHHWELAEELEQSLRGHFESPEATTV